MKTPHDALIAMLLGDAPASPALERWLATDAGRRELAAYRRTLAALERVVGSPTTSGRQVYYCAVGSPIGRLFVAASDSSVSKA